MTKLVKRRRLRLGLEAPDDSGGSTVIVLCGAAVVTAEVVALDSPGEIFEAKFVVGTAAYVPGEWIVDETVGVDVANSGHAVNKGTPLSVTKREARAAEEHVLRNSLPEEGAAFGDEAEAWEASKGKGFVRAFRTAITLLVDDVGELAIRNANVNVAIGKKTVELCRHRDREQHECNEGQDSGGKLWHEIFLRGGCAGKTRFDQRNLLDAVYWMPKMSQSTKFVPATAGLRARRMDENLPDIYDAKTKAPASMY